MEKYQQRVPPSASSLIQITLTSPRCTLLVIAVFGSRVTHSRVLPERSTEPWRARSSPRVPGWCVPLRTAQRAYHTLAFHHDGGWGKIHKFYLTRECVSCLDDRGSVTGGLRGNSHSTGTRAGRSPPLPLPGHFLRMVRVQPGLLPWPIDWLPSLHGFLGQLSSMMLLWGLVALPPRYYPTSPNFTEWIGQSAAGWDRAAEQQLCRSSRCCASLSVSLHTVRRNLRRATGQGATVKFVRRKIDNLDNLHWVSKYVLNCSRMVKKKPQLNFPFYLGSKTANLYF